MASSAYRRKCLEAKGERCIECGATEAIEVHHLNGDRTDDDLDNLVPLCRLHHRRLHRTGLNGLEDQILPVDERAQIDRTLTTFQITVPCDKWDRWKETVPRSKSLEQRIIELIEADTEGRVEENQ